MAKIIVFFTAFITLSAFLVACDSPRTKKSKEKKEIANSTNEGDVEIDSATVAFAGHDFIKEVTLTQIKQLKKHLKPGTVDAIISFVNALKYCQTDSNLDSLYYGFEKTALKIEQEISKKFPDGYQGMEKLEVLNSIFGLNSACVAECTEFQFRFKLNELQQLAKATKGNADDTFFKLKQMAEGETATYIPGWLTFFARTWDYGGGVLVGNDSIRVFLADSWKLQKQTELFSKDIKLLRAAAIQNASHPIYMYPKTKVLKELNAILISKITSPSESKEIKAIISKIQGAETDPPIQYNCEDENANCDWGG